MERKRSVQSSGPIPEHLKAWERTQYKSFRNWVNINLSKREPSVPLVARLESDFENGLALLHLLEVVSGESVGRYNKAPRIVMQQAENCGRAIAFIEEQHIRLESIGGEDIRGGNLKLIMGLIWTLILHYQLGELSLGAEAGAEAAAGGNPKDHLLAYVRDQVAGYGVEVNNFTTSFQDGRVLCAMVHRKQPSLVPFATLEAAHAEDNNHLALYHLESAFDVPHVVDAEDLATHPDDKAVMTLLSYVVAATRALPDKATSPSDTGGAPEPTGEAPEGEEEGGRGPGSDLGAALDDLCARISAAETALIDQVGAARDDGVGPAQATALGSEARALCRRARDHRASCAPGDKDAGALATRAELLHARAMALGLVLEGTPTVEQALRALEAAQLGAVTGSDDAFAPEAHAQAIAALLQRIRAQQAVAPEAHVAGDGDGDDNDPCDSVASHRARLAAAVTRCRLLQEAGQQQQKGEADALGAMVDDLMELIASSADPGVRSQLRDQVGELRAMVGQQEEAPGGVAARLTVAQQALGDTSALDALAQLQRDMASQGAPTHAEAEQRVDELTRRVTAAAADAPAGSWSSGVLENALHQLTNLKALTRCCACRSQLESDLQTAHASDGALTDVQAQLRAARDEAAAAKEARERAEAEAEEARLAAAKAEAGLRATHEAAAAIQAAAGAKEAELAAATATAQQLQAQQASDAARMAALEQELSALRAQSAREPEPAPEPVVDDAFGQHLATTLATTQGALQRLLAQVREADMQLLRQEHTYVDVVTGLAMAAQERAAVGQHHEEEAVARHDMLQALDHAEAVLRGAREDLGHAALPAWFVVLGQQEEQCDTLRAQLGAWSAEWASVLAARQQGEGGPHADLVARGTRDEQAATRSLDDADAACAALRERGERLQRVLAQTDDAAHADDDSDTRAALAAAHSSLEAVRADMAHQASAHARIGAAAGEWAGARAQVRACEALGQQLQRIQTKITATQRLTPSKKNFHVNARLAVLKAHLAHVLTQIGAQAEHLHWPERWRGLHSRARDVTEARIAVVEVRRRLNPSGPLPASPPVTPTKPAAHTDEVDASLQDELTRLGINVTLKRCRAAQYELPSGKKINMKLLSGHLVVRIGGGYMKFPEWCERYGKKEGIEINPVPLSGVGAHVLKSDGTYSMQSMSSPKKE